MHGDVALEEIEELVVASTADDTSFADDEEDVDGNLTQSVVKMKLAKFIVDGDVRNKITSVVREINVLLGEAYALANFHILRLFSRGKASAQELPKIDRNLYYRCLIGLADANTKNGTITEDILASIDAFEALKPRGFSRINIRGSVYNQILASASITMATMATNHLWMNLERRVKTYLSWRHPDLRRQHKLIVDALVHKPRASLDTFFAPKANASPNLIDKLGRARDVAQELRSVMQLPSKTQYASRAHLTLPLYFKILSETETQKLEQHRMFEEPSTSTTCPTRRVRYRTFTLLPMKGGYTTSYVQLSTMAFLGLLKRLKKATFDGDGRELSDEQKKSVWASVCNLKAVETYGEERDEVGNRQLSRRFAGQIVTDGCSVSILMKRKACIVCPSQGEDAVARAKSHFEAKTVHGIVGVDPGFSDVVTVAGMDNKTKSFSSAEYYQRALYNTSRRRTDKWNAETTGLVVSIPTSETASVERFTTYLQSYLLHLPALIRHRMDKGYRNMRFLRFCWKKNMVQRISEFIAPRQKSEEVTIVGFGDWQGGHGSPISRRTCGPLQEIKLDLRSRPDVVLLDVDEFRTSITCSHCHNHLCNMKGVTTQRVDRKDGTIRQLTNQKVHKVLHCKSNECESHNHTTWNRDVNASRNILMLAVLMLRGWDRPAAFCRTQPKRARATSRASRAGA